MNNQERVEEIRERSTVDPLRFDVSRAEAMVLLAHIDTLTKELAEEKEDYVILAEVQERTKKREEKLRAQRDAVVKAAEPLTKSLPMLQNCPDDMPVNNDCSIFSHSDNVRISHFRALAEAVEEARE